MGFAGAWGDEASGSNRGLKSLLVGKGKTRPTGNSFGFGEGHGDIHSTHHPGPCGRYADAYGGLTTLDSGSTVRVKADPPAATLEARPN